MRNHDYDIAYHACIIAEKSDMKCKHGCVILDKKGKKISSACNTSVLGESDIDKRYKNGKRISIHAEENALRCVDIKKLNGARLYVFRKGQGDQILNSKPCERCITIINSFMKKYGLKIVYYSAGNQ